MFFGFIPLTWPRVSGHFGHHRRLLHYHPPVGTATPDTAVTRAHSLMGTAKAPPPVISTVGAPLERVKVVVLLWRRRPVNYFCRIHVYARNINDLEKRCSVVLCLCATYESRPDYDPLEQARATPKEHRGGLCPFPRRRPFRLSKTPSGEHWPCRPRWQIGRIGPSR